MVKDIARAGGLAASILVLFFLIATTTAAAPITVVGPAAIRIPASANSGTATLHVKSDTRTHLTLSVGDLVDRSTKDVLPGTVTFDPAALDAEPGQVYKIKATASGILFEGDVEVDILNEGTKIGSLVVARSQFAVTLSESRALLQCGQKTALTLRNDSRDPYELLWMAQIGAQKYCGSGKDCESTSNWLSVRIPPKDQVSIEFEPPADWFDGAGAFSERMKEATLWLAFPGDVPKRALTLQASLQGRFYPGQTLWIIIFLAMGAFFSLIVRHWVPNTQRKRDLKDQLRRISLKIDGFSPDIEADLRTQTRVQWELQNTLRKSTWTILPDYATVAAQCAQSIALLERRVDLIEAIDSVCERQRVLWDTCPPPSHVDRVDDLSRSASEGLRNTQPSEAELISIKSQIDTAKALTEQASTLEETFGKELADRLQHVREEIGRFRGKKAYNDLVANLPGVFETVGEPPPQTPVEGAAGASVNGAGVIPPSRFSLVDYDLSALEICRDYIWLFEGTKEPSIAESLEKEIKPVLLKHLSRQSWNELRLARLLLKQFREDSSESQMWNAINAGTDAMYVAYVPSEIHFQQLVQFRAVFRQDDLNWAAAGALVTPEWDFGDGPPSRGWVMSHFFTDRRNRWERMGDRLRRLRGETAECKRPVRVSFERTKCTDPPTTERKEHALTEGITVFPHSSNDRWTRTFSEIVGLLVSISIPLVSLVAGAREQLVQNPAGGALMMFLLGFSSDALISVFKQRVTPSS